MLAKLLPHKSVERHTDMGELLPRIHRCHLPIKTNINVSFVIDETPFYFECGTWYELDNTRQHSVVNKSDEARIHLIVDILPHGVGAV
jgi:aspartyl/asparaginyl beta-hydroxylase (cupin superfamily)